MSKVHIDLSNQVTCPEHLNFYNNAPKRTGTGVHFCSYYGLRMYLITGKKDGKYLQGCFSNDHDHDKYEFVPNLVQQMEDALKLNLSKFPFLTKMLKLQQPEFIWSAYGIRECEKEWFNVVRKVINEL